MSRTSLKAFTLAVGIAALISSAASAQVTRPAPAPVRNSGTIDGIVSDTNLVPLHAAFVTVFGTPLKIGTGANGRFRITNVPVGQYLLMVKRVGYRPTSAVVVVPASDTLRLAYTLEPIAQNLDPVVVAEKPFSQRMQDFYTRKKAGFGEFMTQEEIQDKNPVYPTELFRNFKTINVGPNRSNAITEWFALSRREGANPQTGACPMAVFLDNVPLPTPFNLDLLPPPRDLAGIEVYNGPSTSPPQYSGYGRSCGVILVWTRDGSQTP